MTFRDTGGVILAFMHMMLTELRVWIMFAFGSYKQYQAVASYRALSIAMDNKRVVQCLHDGNITFSEIETCVLDRYNTYLITGMCIF